MKLNRTEDIGSQRARLQRPNGTLLRQLATPGFAGLLGLAATAVPSNGVSINYGDFGPVGSGVQFLRVTESSGTDAVPLYGAPTLFDTGIDFDPVGFATSSVGGLVDITDGQLNLTIQAAPGTGFSFISLFERGDYTLAGLGTSASSVLFGSSIHATVTAINGVGVAPVPLVSGNASVAFNLEANRGVVQPWSLGLNLNIAGQLAPDQLATEVEIVINNALISISQPQSVTFGSKKDFRLEVDTIQETAIRNPSAGIAVGVPETGSTVWLLGGAIGFVLLSRRWTAGSERV